MVVANPHYKRLAINKAGFANFADFYPFYLGKM